ncbi:MAG TPA: nuclear transport factor 2 family protein [Spongiibacteraceae bacterium]|nr:nuclear transport factor 2 family protein [Spongiibacteraceae bacterium]
MSDTRVVDFLDAFRRLDIDHLGLLDRIYHPDVLFIDPFHRLQGLQRLHEYFAGLYANINHCHFKFEPPRSCGDEAFLRWQMDFSHPRLRSGREVSVPGISHVRFAGAENRVVFHEDFYDAGALLYEHIPVLGSAVRFLKRRMSA